jgi:crotonobetainyl-CoA:carnitine CoA-transferase CaiB-like acyl-CoA transferase
VAGRTLAAYGADVMLVNSPSLPNIEAIADTSRGKRSAFADLNDAADRAAFEQVLAASHAFLQSYRPSALDRLGFGPADAARLRPGIVCVSLSAYGRLGPWATRRGFDSLVQTATGFNAAEAEAAGSATPKPLPMQILDMASGFLLAFGTEAAPLAATARGWQLARPGVEARTALWLRELGRVEHGFGEQRLGLRPARGAAPCGQALAHAGSLPAPVVPARNRSARLELMSAAPR